IIGETNSSASDRYLFTGREFDRVTGLQYNRARYYDPTTGRWTSPDPRGFAAGGSNLHRYVHNSPTKNRDPSGLDRSLKKITITDKPRGLNGVRGYPLGLWEGIDWYAYGFTVRVDATVAKKECVKDDAKIQQKIFQLISFTSGNNTVNYLSDATHDNSKIDV